MHWLVFPYLRISSGTEFAPQIQFVAQTELAAEGICHGCRFQVLEAFAPNDPLNEGTNRAQNIGRYTALVALMAACF